MRKLYLALFFLVLCSLTYAQTPQGISYQAVVREGNSLKDNAFIKVIFKIHHQGTVIYEESHNVMTNDYGLFTLIIGEGIPDLGSFSSIDWSQGNYDLQVFFDTGTAPVDMGTSPLVSVPYSLYANRAKTVDSLSITDLIDVNDVSANPGQILQWDGTSWTAVDLPAYQAGNGIQINGSTIENVGDTDASDDITNTTSATGDLSGTFPSPQVTGLRGTDLAPFLNSAANGQVLKWDDLNQHWAPANDNGEIYTPGTGISISGNSISNTLPDQTVSILGTGAISVTGTYPNFALFSTTNFDDADANPVNELQTLSMTGDSLGISSGNKVHIPPQIIYNEGTGIDIIGTTIHNAAPDLPVSLNSAGSTTISGTYPNFTISSTDNVNDADADPANELQDLSLVGNTLSITDGNQVTLPAGVNYSGGTGIDITGGVISNTLPDQTVNLTQGGATTISGTYPNFTISSTDNVDDADADPANELQDLSLVGNTLSITDGNQVTLPAGVNYSGGTGIDITGGVISNTLPDQTVSLTQGGATTVSGTYPNFFISSTDNVDDADADPANELQDLSLVGNTLSITDGNQVTLPAGVNYSGGTGIDITSGVISNTLPDQTVNLTQGGATTISGTYPNFFISSTDNVNDADADPANELQDLNLVGNTLSITDGNQVILPAGVNYSGGTGIDITSGVISNTLPDQVVSLTQGGATTITGTYPNFTISSTDNVNDDDFDPENELQALNLVGNTLSITDGNQVILPAGVNYSGGTGIDITSGVISNTLPDQVVSLTQGGATTITGTYPNFTISSTDNVNDDDFDPENELQALNLVGNTLSISSGNQVTLPAGVTYTAGAGIDLTNDIITNTAPDQVVSLTQGGATTISGTYPNFTISSTDNVNDADSNPTNEIQALSLNGSVLSITGQANGINLSGIYSAGNGITLVNSIIENSAPDKIVSLTGSGATTVTGTYPNFTISSTDNVNDSDASAFNEVITSMSFDNTDQTLTIVEAGSTHTAVFSGLGGGGGGSLIEDSDQDTKIQVEESADEDVIRFDVKGQEVLVLDRRSAGQTLINPNPNTNDVYIGKGSGLNSDPGAASTAVGDSALHKNGLGGSSSDHGTNNTAVGASAMKNTSTGHDNVAVGAFALTSNQGGVNLTAVGSLALNSNINGHSNVAVGEKSLRFNTTGVNNTAIGTLALENNTTASNNTVLGRSAMLDNTIGGHNVAIGRSALENNSTGFSSVAVGTRALFSNKTISNLVAVGDSALYNNGQTASGSTEASNNTAVGSKALYENRKGYYNTAVGYEALIDNTNGYHNSAFGRYALFKNISAPNNTALGSGALFDNTSGEGNTAVGRSTLSNNVGGDNNTAVGYSAFNANSATSYSNSTAIGYDAEITGSNQVRIGNTFVGSIGGYAGWTNFSDGRFKTLVQENVKGLDFILRLRPVTYQLDVKKLSAKLGEGLDEEGRRVSNSRHQTAKDQRASERHTGFIAQEVEQAATAVGFDFNGVDQPDGPEDHYGLRYSAFVVPLVKAIQEQQQIIETQRATNQAQHQTIQDLEARLARLEAMIVSQVND